MPVPSISGALNGHDTWRMEQFSRAYALAVASVAGCAVEWPPVDIDSVDATLRWRTTTTAVRSPALDVQLKATYQDCVGDAHVTYDLAVKNYDELRATNHLIQRILCVVVVPAVFEDWTCTRNRRSHCAVADIGCL